MGDRERRPGSAGVPPARSAGTPDSKWHSRGYLPHFDQPGLVQMITFRLADALPSSVLSQVEDGLGSPSDARKRERLEAFMDAGHGACHLRDARIARVVEDTLLFFDGVRYRLIAWVVMPNHVHVLIETMPGHTLSRVSHSWKSYSSKEAGKILGLTGRLWQPECYDRAIRHERHLATAVRYIHENPVRAGLAQEAEDWPFGSAAREGKGRAGGTPALPGGPPTLAEKR